MNYKTFNSENCTVLKVIMYYQKIQLYFLCILKNHISIEAHIYSSRAFIFRAPTSLKFSKFFFQDPVFSKCNKVI